jgi:hypothetical protein
MNITGMTTAQPTQIQIHRGSKQNKTPIKAMRIT